MAEWSVMYPVDFTANGDKTNQAIQKHITEISRLYGVLSQLRNNFSGAGYPSGPVRNQLYVNPTTFAAKVFVGVNGENDWRDLVCAPSRHDLDKHNAGLMQDLQDLISDAFLLSLSVAPGAADAGKVAAVDDNGKVVLSDVALTQAATILTLNAAITLINQTLATLTSRVLALETAVADIPVLESVAALPANPDPNTWYFVQGAAT